MRYNWNSNKWLVYDGIRWNAEEGEAIAHNYALEVARDIYQEAITKKDVDDKKKCFAWALKSESAFGISNMLKLARALPTIRTYSKFLNTDIYLLNCNDGTVDLRTGKLEEHDPADMITELAPVDFDIDAKQVQPIQDTVPNEQRITASMDKGYVIPNAEAALGLGWGCYFSDEEWHFDLSAAWEFHHFWNQNMMRQFVDTLATGVDGEPADLTYQGLTISLQLDF